MGTSLTVVPNGTTNELDCLLFTLSPLMLCIMQRSYKYQLLSHWYDRTLNRTPSLPFQKQTLYPLGHLSGNNLFTIFPPSEPVIIGKCAVDQECGCRSWKLKRSYFDGSGSGSAKNMLLSLPHHSKKHTVNNLIDIIFNLIY